MKSIPTKTFKRCGEMQDGIRLSVAAFVNRAKEAHKRACEAKKAYENGAHYQHELWLRYRAERSHWLFAAKFLLTHTTNGIAHFEVNARQISRMMSKQEVAA